MQNRSVTGGAHSVARYFGLPLVLLIAVVVNGCGSRPDEQPVDSGPEATSGAEAIVADLDVSDADLADLDAVIPGLLEEAGIPGLSIAVYRRGNPIWARAYGVVDADSGDPVTEDTVFEAASLSKPVYAFAVMHLIERGELSLDVSLAEIYPYDRLEHEERYRQITPRMVMSHSTGLPNWGGDRLELAFDPGSEFSYSGEGFVFLERAVTELTGEDLGTLLSDEVFEPLGLEHSSYVWIPEYDDLSAVGHDSLGRPQPKGTPRRANAAASLHTTATDYARFVGALLEEEGLRPETFETMFATQIDAPGEDGEFAGLVSWALGWGLQRGEQEMAFWHWGDNGPFKAFVIGYREAGAGLVYFANSNDGLAIVGPIISRVFGDRHSSVDWLGYERYDAPARLARLSIQRAYLEGGDEAGTIALGEVRAESPEIADEDFLNSLGYFLLAERLYGAAIAIFAENVSNYPESANAHDSLGEAYLQADRMTEAVASYERAASLDPENETAPRAIEWARQSISARTAPPAVPEALLRSYVGDYGPRHIRYQEGVLVYQRDGNPSYRLYPIATDTFGLEGLGYFRIRFRSDAAGNVIGLTGVYATGREDNSDRSG